MNAGAALARGVDAALDVAVAPGFTKLGYEARRRLGGWRSLDDYHLDGRRIVVTGATSGLGRAAAERLADAGATVVAVGRDERRLAELRRSHGDRIETEAVDLSDLDAVAALAGRLVSSSAPVDTLIHNAGALLHERTLSPQGIELTVAVHVVAPFVLTRRLLDHPPPRPEATPTRVLTHTSGGMYAAPLEVEHLQMSPDRYDGTRQYALAKRAQVVLNEMWAERVGPARAVFHAVHPGWADTPGVAASLPTFRRIVGPALRDADEGADTIAWLAADPAALESTGLLWHDRRPRPTHRLPSTRRSDTPERRRELWDWVEAAAGDHSGTVAAGDHSGTVAAGDHSSNA